MAEWLPIHYGYITLSVLGILLNSIVIYLFLRRKYLRKMHSNIFLFSLAISDLCYAAIAIPLILSCDLNPNLSGPIPPECLATEYTMVFFGFSTVYHILLGISEKLCAISIPLKHHSVFCRSIAIKLSCFVWFLSAILTHIPVWWEFFFPSDGKVTSDRNEAYYRFHFATGFALPMLASAVMYSIILHKIFKALNRRLSEQTNRNKQRMRAERKAALTFAIMLAAFIFAWTTWFLGRIRVPISTEESVNTFMTISRFLDPVLNPILYTFLKHDFRRAFLSLVRSKAQNDQLLKMRTTRLHNHATGELTQEDTLHTSPYSVKRYKNSMKHSIHHHDHHKHAI